MKRIIYTLVLLATLLPASLSLKAAERIEIDIDHVAVNISDAAPYIDKNGRTMVPVRVISENLGAQVDWDPVSKAFRILGVNVQSNEDVEIIGEAMTPYVTVNNIRKQLDRDNPAVVVLVKGNRCYVPIRFFSTELGYNIAYRNHKVYIKTDGEEEPQGLETSSIYAFEQKVIELTNQKRAKHGLAPLRHHPELGDVARVKSEDMYEDDYFAHESPTYGSPFDMMEIFEIDHWGAAENIAMGQRTPEEVVDAWIKSPGHLANMLGDYSHIGVGYVEEAHIWTQMFIRVQ